MSEMDAVMAHRDSMGGLSLTKQEADGVARVLRERDAYRRALEEIAGQDYRGNRSRESQIAYRAIKGRV